jgi:hypothetical protein
MAEQALSAERQCDVRPVNVRNYGWRAVGATIVLCAGLAVDSPVKSTLVAAQPAARWKDIQFSWGWLGREQADASCDFNHRLRSEYFDLSVERDRIAFSLPPINYPYHGRSCPSDRREITITRIGFSRGLRGVHPAVGGGDVVSAAVAVVGNIFTAKAITRYFLSLDYLPRGGDEASATFYFEGQDATALLTLLSRISKVPVDVPESEAARFGQRVNLSVSPDPHRRLLANVPIWESQALALEGSISEIAPDGSIALANHAIWDLQTGKLRRRLAGPPHKRDTMRELLAGEGRWLLWAGNSGALNSRNAMRAGEVTITDTTAAAPVAHVAPLPYIIDVLLAPEANLAIVVGKSHAQEDPYGSSVSTIALDRGEVIWQAPVPRRPTIGRSDAARVLAFGRDWIRLWNAATGETLFDSIAVLRQADQPPVAILNAASVEDRIILVYTTNVGTEIASIDIHSGRVLKQTQLSSRAIPHQTRTWWSPARNVLLVAFPDRWSLWDTDTQRLVGDLNPQPGRGISADFGASGELLATMRDTSEGLDRHVVITDVHTRTPIGQCLLGDAERMHLTSDGRTVLGYQGNRLLFCKRAD